IIHDWEDEEAVAILRTVREQGGTLLLVERVVEPANEGPETKLGDLNMLVGPGGQERTLEEFRALFAAAGYELSGDTTTASGMHVLEGAPGLEERLAAELDRGHAHQRGPDQDQQAREAHVLRKGRDDAADLVDRALHLGALPLGGGGRLVFGVRVQ